MSLSERLVAHRGYMERYPENTLCALKAAADAGAHMLEFDIQLTRDKVPFLLHDATLDRTTGSSGRIMELQADDLGRYSAHYPERFGDRFNPTPIPALSEAVALLNALPEITAFVEIKRQSLSHFGIPTVVDRVIGDLQQGRFAWVLISFRADALRYARQAHGALIGWVLPENSPVTQGEAETLNPDYLFGDSEKLSETGFGLWPGPWRWCIYDIRGAEEALTLFTRGSHLIETGCIGELINCLQKKALP
ncbi:MAG: glycerophosphodiester phosphodiesterase family protein [Gammaproteobacteria bacterium]